MSYANEIRDVLFFDRFVDCIIIIIIELDDLDTERVVRPNEFILDCLHQEINPLRILDHEGFPVISDSVRIVANDGYRFSTDPVDDLIDPGTFTRVFVGIVLVLVDLNNDAMTREIEIDVGTFLAAPLEHLARIVLEAGIDLFPEATDDGPFFLVLDLFTISADVIGFFANITVSAQSLDTDQTGI